MKILTMTKDGKRLDILLEKAGTSEGALKGWEGRRKLNTGETAPATDKGGSKGYTVKNPPPVDLNSDWERRVRAEEEKGATRSDAQGIVDAQDMNKPPSGDYKPSERSVESASSGLPRKGSEVVFEGKPGKIVDSMIDRGGDSPIKMVQVRYHDGSQDSWEIADDVKMKSRGR